MNILFISSLYPTHENSTPTKITFALHNIIKSWNQYENTNILVIRPVFLYLREIFKKKIFFNHKTIFIENVKIIVYPIFKIPKIAYYYTPLYRFLNRYLKRYEINPEIIVAHYDKSLQIGYQYSLRRKLPLVSGFHITPDLMADNPEAFTRRCGKILKTSSSIACRSNYIYKKITNWYPQYQSKSFIAYSGIEEKLVEPPNTSIQKLNQWKKNKKLSIITVSSLIERKKIDTILYALAGLEKDTGNAIEWTYSIIGAGEDQFKLEQLASQLGIKERVEFKGQLPKEQVIAHLKQSHIFILVSYLETFGLVYLEAMATGNIVIGSKGEGIDGIIKHQINGFLSTSGSQEELKKILEDILFTYTQKTLEQVIQEANRTIIEYTDTKAAQNYWEHLKLCQQHSFNKT